MVHLPGNFMTLIEVEKEAIVLFSEALEVVGDAYAIAGFSGAGRLGEIIRDSPPNHFREGNVFGDVVARRSRCFCCSR